MPTSPRPVGRTVKTPKFWQPGSRDPFNFSFFFPHFFPAPYALPSHTLNAPYTAQSIRTEKREKKKKKKEKKSPVLHSRILPNSDGIVHCL